MEATDNFLLCIYYLCFDSPNEIQLSSPQGFWYTAGTSVSPVSTACTAWGVCLNVGGDFSPKCLIKWLQIMFSESKTHLTKDL